MLLWVLDPAERDAVLAYDSSRKWGPGDRALIEIACARRSDELFAARRAYHARYKRAIEEDVAAHAKGDFRKLLVLLLSAYRYEGPEVNLTLAKSEAKLLHEKIEDKSYADDEIIRVITTRSKAQLAATFNAYHNAFGHPINKDLKSDPKDHFLSALRAIIKCITSPEKYFEKAIRLSIDRIGTDEEAVTRVITTRAEFDLKLIKELYHKRNSKPLLHAIKKETSGDYEDFLVAIIGE